MTGVTTAEAELTRCGEKEPARPDVDGVEGRLVAQLVGRARMARLMPDGASAAEDGVP